MTIITFNVASVVFIMRSQRRSRENYFIYFPMFLSSFVFFSMVFFSGYNTRTPTHTYTHTLQQYWNQRSRNMSINQRSCVQTWMSVLGTGVIACALVCVRVCVSGVHGKVDSSFWLQTFQYPFKCNSNYHTDNYTHARRRATCGCRHMHVDARVLVSL